MKLPQWPSTSHGLADRTKQLFDWVASNVRPSRKRRVPERLQRSLRRAGTGLATTAALVAGYRYLFQPWHQTWGATKEDVTASLPGDGLVPKPSYQTTRAITIEASPEEIWPWLVQMGQGRGGFYSYDWLENLFGLDIHNTDRVVADWQELKPGDEVRLAPSSEYDGRAKMRVVHLEPSRALVFGPAVDSAEDYEAAAQTGAGTWAFVLDPVEDERTRLLVRTRSRPWQAPRAAFLVYDPAHFIMERKMMLGLKQRAESGAATSDRTQTEVQQPTVEHES